MTTTVGNAVVVVTGAKGGVGATTVATAIAKAANQLETTTGEQVTARVSPTPETPTTFVSVVDVSSTAFNTTLDAASADVVIPVVVTRASIEALLATNELLGQLPSQAAHVVVTSSHSQTPEIIGAAAAQGVEALAACNNAGRIYYVPWTADIELHGASSITPDSPVTAVAAALLANSEMLAKEAAA